MDSSNKAVGKTLIVAALAFTIVATIFTCYDEWSGSAACWNASTLFLWFRCLTTLYK